MITATTIKCDKCGNEDPAQFETVISGGGGYKRRDYPNGPTLKGAKCMRCGHVMEQPK